MRIASGTPKSKNQAGPTHGKGTSSLLANREAWNGRTS
jgi:hypothetical protein